MAGHDRVYFNSSNDLSDILKPEFNNLVAELYDEFVERIAGAREARRDMQQAALRGTQPGHLAAGQATTTAWNVPNMPAELREPGIEISGPADITSMLINALNPGPDGARATGDLDDDEDAGGHSLESTVQATRNRLGAASGDLKYQNPQSGKHYELKPGKLPFFMHRERGLHLDEQEYLVDGKPIPATILGTAATLFYAGQAQHERGEGIYFYIPKTESPEEAAIYRDLFMAIQNRLPQLSDAVIRGILLVESLPLVWAMEEALYALGPYAAGLNAARWDLKASMLEYSMADPSYVWPDRFGVSVAGTPYIANIFRCLVAICLKHNAIPIGGMATALPSRDEEVNREAATAITADKDWEANQGFLRAWVAHIYHMSAAAEPFKRIHATRHAHTAEMANPQNYPISIEHQDGPITLQVTRENARILIEYLEGWLAGRGAKGIDRFLGQPGKRPSLMEDLATARISVGQIAQRVIHRTIAEDTDQPHTPELAKQILIEEGEEIIRFHGSNADKATIARYQAAVKIAMHWTKNYIDLDFRSLGSYTRAHLAEIAAAPESL